MNYKHIHSFIIFPPDVITSTWYNKEIGLPVEYVRIPDVFIDISRVFIDHTSSSNDSSYLGLRQNIIIVGLICNVSDGGELL